MGHLLIPQYSAINPIQLNMNMQLTKRKIMNYYTNLHEPSLA